MGEQRRIERGGLRVAVLGDARAELLGRHMPAEAGHQHRAGECVGHLAVLFGEHLLDSAPQRLGTGGLHPARRHGIRPLIQPGLRADTGHPEQHVGFLTQFGGRLVDHVLPRLGQPA